jgi:hypothetical protein
MDLIDPKILYSSFHNTTSFSPIWNRHHDAFAKFIKGRLHGQCIEIGGSSGELYKRLCYDNYKTLDFANPGNNEKHIRGNCETFDFTGVDCVIMSHVFEHLYNPADFYENCKVSDIFISIPSIMNETPFKLHREHTYLCDEADVIRLFKGYSCRIEYFENHSIFIHLFRKPKLLDATHQYTSLHTDYIFPSSICGSHILYYSKADIIGFIDNDPNKQGKFIMGREIFARNNQSNVFMGYPLYNSEYVINNRLLISHRGNTTGPNKDLENTPEYIDQALDQGFDVEIDVWVIDTNIFLGHDTPDHSISSSFLIDRRNKLWCHAKNLDAMTVLKALDMNAFFHDTDKYVYTTKGFIWAHPTSTFSNDTICVMSDTNPPGCLGYCSDFVSDMI